MVGKGGKSECKIKILLLPFLPIYKSLSDNLLKASQPSFIGSGVTNRCSTVVQALGFALQIRACEDRAGLRRGPTPSYYKETDTEAN